MSTAIEKWDGGPVGGMRIRRSFEGKDERKECPLIGTLRVAALRLEAESVIVDEGDRGDYGDFSVRAD